MLEVLPLSPRTADTNWPKQYSILRYVMLNIWTVGKALWSPVLRNCLGRMQAPYTTCIVYYIQSLPYIIYIMPGSHTFQYIPINHHDFTFSLWAIPLKFLLPSFNQWLWSPSVIVVLQGKRDSVWWWIVLCWSQFWFHHHCSFLVLSLLWLLYVPSMVLK